MDARSVTDLDRLLRWEAAGGTWRVLNRRPGLLTVALRRCDGGEAVDHFSSADPDLLALVEQRGEEDPARPFT